MRNLVQRVEEGFIAAERCCACLDLLEGGIPQANAERVQRELG